MEQLAQLSGNELGLIETALAFALFMGFVDLRARPFFERERTIASDVPDPIGSGIH